MSILRDTAYIVVAVFPDPDGIHLCARFWRGGIFDTPEEACAYWDDSDLPEGAQIIEIRPIELHTPQTDTDTDEAHE